MMGMSRRMKRIMTYTELQKSKSLAARQDGSREFITLLACISAAGVAVAPTLIYKGASNELQDTWVDEVEEGDDAYFATSANGWSSNAFGLAWLQKVFDPQTKKKGSRNYRLLIVDGHSSHVNLAFLEGCKRLRIIILILPPHSTHRLQPLDVGLFLPLSTYYGKELDLIMHRSDGITSLSKRNFWKVFKRAWDQAFTETNIKKAFAKTGIWPQNPRIVMAQIEPREPPKPTTPLRKSYNDIKTPYSAIALRKFKKELKIKPSLLLIDKILKANETLHARAKIAEHRCEGFREALKDEKKKRKRGKRLDLKGDESNGAAIWGSKEITKARQRQNEKDALEEQERIDKELIKTTKQAAKVQQELEKQEKRAAKEVTRQITKESKAASKGTSRRRNTRQNGTGTAGSKQQMVILRSKLACEAFQQSEIVTLMGEAEEVVPRRNRGRLTGVGKKART
jgi:hypothetical protein